MIAFIYDHRVGSSRSARSCRSPLDLSCRCCQTARSGAGQDAALKIEVRRVFDQNFSVYGVGKVWGDLRREGFDVARCGVAIDAGHGFARGIRGKTVKTTICDKAAPLPQHSIDVGTSEWYKALIRGVDKYLILIVEEPWTDNPADGVSLDVRSKQGEKKRSFTDEEAKVILRAALLEKDPVRRWVPWIGAYSGARVSEICQLRAEDIIEIDRIWCMKLDPEAGSLKTSGVGAHHSFAHCVD